MKTIVALTALSIAAATPALAQDIPVNDAPAPAAHTEFLGVDLDNGNVFYNGINSGRYCVYRTIEVFNTRNGTIEWRRVRHCGRGVYVR